MASFSVLSPPDHVCLAVHSFEEAQRFWGDTLGFPAQVGQDGVFQITSAFSVSTCSMEMGMLVEATGWATPAAGLAVHAETWAQMNNHIALPVDNLSAVAERTLAGGYETFQMDEMGNRVDVTDPNSLGYGLRSLFVYDGSRNLIEFGMPSLGTWQHSAAAIAAATPKRRKPRPPRK